MRRPAKAPKRPSASARPARRDSRLPRVPDHELVERIGAGSYGEVWLARNIIGSLRAAKIVFRSRFSEARPFDREFAGLQRFEPISRSHPGFVSILHVGRNDRAGYFYSIMELADDAGAGATPNYIPRTLANELAARGRLPVSECVQIGMELASALGHLHEHGLAHRDVKPSNVIFIKGTPRLADIGLVMVIGEPSTAIGTEGYIAPEGPGTAVADLYSLGILLYQSATGKPLHQFPDLPTGLPEHAEARQLMNLNELILRATERDPRRRYQSAAEMGRALFLLNQSEGARDGGANRSGSGHLKSMMKGERKQVTALALDICWQHKLDPEEASTLMREIFERLQTELQTYGGAVNQRLSNGLLAVFGAPSAYEDHTRRAVHASLAIRRAVASLDGFWREKGAVHQIRCGIDTGLAVVADEISAVTGEPLQRALQLCHWAKPGSLLVSGESWKAIQYEFASQRFGTPGSAGWPESPVYEVTGLIDHSSLEGASGKKLSRFVGRSRELAVLQDRISESAAGRGQVVLVAGEPGMGKSRLLLEFRRALLNQPFTWLTQRSLSFGKDVALLPVIEAVKQLLRIDPGEGPLAERQKRDALEAQIPTKLAWTRPYLSFLLGTSAENSEVAAMDARHRKTKTFEALRALLLEKAQREPLVLVVEDLHWSDAASEEFVCSLTDSLPMSRLLVVATYRPGYHSPFPERSYITRLTVTPLTESEALQIVQDIVGSSACPGQLQQLIASKAEGNPFFIEELVKSLLETGALRAENGRCVLEPGGAQVPDTVQNVLMSRIDRLPEPAKKTLQLASVIGREFQIPLLETLADLHDPLQESLQQLKNAELIYERPLLADLTCVFKHALTQEVAYGSLLLQRRKELHRLLAASIEELYAARLPEFHGTLAYHYQLGEEWERALDYLLRAAENSERIGGYREQARLLTQAMDVARRLNELQRLPELQARRGIALGRGGLWVDARKDLEAALDETPPEELETRAELLLELAGACFWSLDLAAMTEYVKQGQVVAEQVGRDDLIAGMMGWSAATDQCAGNLPVAVQRFESALKRAGGFRHISLSVFPLTLYWAGRIKESIERGLQSAEMCTSLGDKPAITFGNSNLGAALASAGRYGEAIRLFEDTLKLASEHELWPFHARTVALSAGLHLDVFDYSIHEAIAEEAREHGRSLGWQPPVVSAGLDLIFNYARQHDISRAEKMLVETAEAIRATGGWHRWLWDSRLAQARAEVAFAREDWKGALEAAADGIAQSSARGRLKYHVASLTTHGRTLAALGRKEEGIAELRFALQLARPVGDPAMFLRVAQPLLALDGDDLLAREAKHARQRILAALPTDVMRQRFLIGTRMT